MSDPWQPIETAPKVGELLVYMPDARFQKIQSARRGKNDSRKPILFIGNNFAFDMPKPSHWMPIPAPPVQS